MALEAERIYPHCPTVIRVVPIGGLTKGELLARRLVKTVGFLRRLDAPLVLALLPLGTLFFGGLLFLDIAALLGLSSAYGFLRFLLVI